MFVIVQASYQELGDKPRLRHLVDTARMFHAPRLGRDSTPIWVKLDDEEAIEALMASDSAKVFDEHYKCGVPYVVMSGQRLLLREMM
jgi:hypothetical protein